VLTGAVVFGAVLARTGGGRLRRTADLDDHLDLPAGAAVTTAQRGTG
jgi:hypothetical protein